MNGYKGCPEKDNRQTGERRMGRRMCVRKKETRKKRDKTRCLRMSLIRLRKQIQKSFRNSLNSTDQKTRQEKDI